MNKQKLIESTENFLKTNRFEVLVDTRKIVGRTWDMVSIPHLEYGSALDGRPIFIVVQLDKKKKKDYKRFVTNRVGMFVNVTYDDESDEVFFELLKLPVNSDGEKTTHWIWYPKWFLVEMYGTSDSMVYDWEVCQEIARKKKC